MVFLMKQRCLTEAVLHKVDKKALQTIFIGKKISAILNSSNLKYFGFTPHTTYNSTEYVQRAMDFLMNM